jgi:hypothetical protein
MMTSDEFITSEVNVWGMDYVFELLDAGYSPIELISETGQIKWTWIMAPKPRLTNAPNYATVS